MTGLARVKGRTVVGCLVGDSVGACNVPESEALPNVRSCSPRTEGSECLLGGRTVVGEGVGETVGCSVGTCHEITTESHVVSNPLKCRLR